MLSQRGRPRSEAKQVNLMIHLRLREGQDDDLIQFFQNCPPKKRALLLKIALRAGGMSKNHYDEDLDKQNGLNDSLNNLIF
jgi:hypothetical protein